MARFFGFLGFTALSVLLTIAMFAIGLKVLPFIWIGAAIYRLIFQRQRIEFSFWPGTLGALIGIPLCSPISSWTIPILGEVAIVVAIGLAVSALPQLHDWWFTRREKTA